MKGRDLTGKKLGKYEIIMRVGRGSTADVYKAFHPQLNRYVGIKTPTPTSISLDTIGPPEETEESPPYGGNG